MESNIALCPGCMHPLPAGAPVCPLCGCPRDSQNTPEFLPVRALLSGRYLVGRLRRFSGATACYAGYDQTGGCPVLIYEYMPAGCCARRSDGSLQIPEDRREAFAAYLDQFRRTARAVARLRDLNIMLPVYDIFEENRTAYTVGELPDARTLTDWLAEKGGRLSWEETRRLFVPFLSSLVSCHTSGLLHLGICPDNILIGTDGRLRLTGFDIPAVRCVGSELKPCLIDGYAAPEQYKPDGTCSAATDVYGVAATLFRVLSGNQPPSGACRDPFEDDLLLSADVAKTLPPYLASTLADGLHPKAGHRISTILDLRDRLSTGKVVSVLSQDTVQSGRAPKKPDPKKAAQKRAMWLAILCITAICISAIAIVVTVCYRPATAEPTTVTTVATTTTTEAESSEPAAPMSAVPNLSGGTYDYYSLPVKDGKAQNGPFVIELVGLKYDDSVRSGMIVAQSPAPGTQLPDGSVIEVTISAGAQPSAVPDVSGWKAEHAKLYLEALGFRVALSEEANSSVDVGCVIGTWPIIGTAPDPASGNKVTLRINNYEKPTTTARTHPTFPIDDAPEASE
ncbi:MAG: PASTA domain-containing protein [Clostridia bacterium]|nr:PASTA domain-containing protein [Clostridia bacterium]